MIKLHEIDAIVEHKSDDPAGRVFVYAGEVFDLYVDAGFFQDLAADALVKGFMKFQHCATAVDR